MSQCADTGYRPDDVAAVVDDTSTPIPDSVTPAAEAPARPPVGDETGAAVADTAGAFQSGPATVAGAGVENRRDDNGTAADESTPQIAPIWNRILGQVDLCPPNSTQQPGPREKRLNELTVFLQRNRFADEQRHHRAASMAERLRTRPSPNRCPCCAPAWAPFEPVGQRRCRP